ncbi:CinA family protein [Enteractinococcus coprophilus]|uniref:Nicotinamide-nucleotide amidase n=1 Tax=Enteractinococcus coprophilus TaxID=1027633 RepID=A0A543AK23_9MICC|nr:nicotinamide-nucleotide amidohydrolase family protein [Enteractinococcus coprophilus]TQL72932.1 nicotinamide-nucleotide amidase [Enteractinococcus coprophilus]
MNTSGATDFSAHDIVAQLKHEDLTIATAESLTAGMLSSTLADVPGASAVLQGGVVAYNNAIKHRLLGVSADILAARGAVDAETAKQMADGARQRLIADLGISTTGVAGPEPSEGKAVGIVFIALSTREQITARLLRFDGNREQIRRSTVAASLRLVGEWLTQKNQGPAVARSV